MLTNTSPLTDEHRRSYRNHGYMILERVIPETQLAMLREECSLAIDRIHAVMDAQSSDLFGISIRNSRYFAMQPSLESPRLKDFLFSELMADVCRATLGPDACLVWEQYVVKAAERGETFSWHQDGGYAMAGGAASHPPDNTCWCALDDMSEANGTIYVLPYERAGGDGLVEHVWNTETSDCVGYFGDDPGDPIIVPAGSIAVFSTHVFHRSGFNSTDKMRRVYLAQYGCAPLRMLSDNELFGRNDAFLQDNTIVAA